MDSIFFVFEIIGVVAFSLSGALTAMKKEMDIPMTLREAGVDEKTFMDMVQNKQERGRYTSLQKRLEEAF